MPALRRKMAIDPVCGAEVELDASHTAVHLGGQYHFCCPRCKTEFERGPERYLAPHRWWKRYLLRQHGGFGAGRPANRN